MGVQDVIAIGVAIAAAVWVLRIFTKSFNGENGCGCAGKPSDTGESSCSAKPRTGLRQQPLVPLENVGRPDATDSRADDANGDG